MHLLPAYTTHETQQGPFELLISLDRLGFANAKVYMDDGHSISPIFVWLHLQVKHNKLTIQTQIPNKESSSVFKILQPLQRITLVGLDFNQPVITNHVFKINQKPVDGHISQFNHHAWVLDGLKLDLNKRWDLAWS